MVYDQKYNTQYQLCYGAVPGGMAILSYNGDDVRVQLPDDLDDQPVIKIGEYAFEDKCMKYIQLPQHLKVIDHHAFSGCRKLERLQLPDGVRQVGNYAFYNCLSLGFVNLPSGIKSMGFGAFKNCENLKEIRQEHREGDKLAVDGILEELGHLIHVEIYYPDEPEGANIAKLSFTEHDYEAGEFTAAWNKQYDSAQIGSGKYMRFCVSSSGIDYHKYDEMFYVILRGDPFEVALKVAIERLRFPYALTAAARQKYMAYVSEHESGAVEYMIKADAIDDLRFIGSQGMITRQGADLGLDLAAGLGKTECTAYLMDYRHSHFSLQDEMFEL